jgi:hypothetical protein
MRCPPLPQGVSSAMLRPPRLPLSPPPREVRLLREPVAIAVERQDGAAATAFAHGEPPSRQQHATGRRAHGRLGVPFEDTSRHDLSTDAGRPRSPDGTGVWSRRAFANRPRRADDAKTEHFLPRLHVLSLGAGVQRRVRTDRYGPWVTVDERFRRLRDDGIRATVLPALPPTAGQLGRTDQCQSRFRDAGLASCRDLTDPKDGCINYSLSSLLLPCPEQGNPSLPPRRLSPFFLSG